MPRLTPCEPREAERRAKIAIAQLGNDNAAKPERKTSLTICLPVNLKTRLAAEATRRGVKVSALTVEAIERLLDAEKEAWLATKKKKERLR